MATRTDIALIKRIADANRESVGFVLQPAIEQSIQSTELFVFETIDGRLLGFLRFHTRKDGVTKIYEICVQDGKRRRGVGSALMGSLRSDVRTKGLNKIELKCPHDMDAEDFYAGIGFQRIGTEVGKKRRLGVWRLTVQ